MKWIYVRTTIKILNANSKWRTSNDCEESVRRGARRGRPLCKTTMGQRKEASKSSCFMLYNSHFNSHSHSRSHFHFHFHFHLQVFIFASNFNACFMIFLFGTNEMHEMFAFYNTAKMYQKRRQKQKPSAWHAMWVCVCVCVCKNSCCFSRRRSIQRGPKLY